MYMDVHVFANHAGKLLFQYLRGNITIHLLVEILPANYITSL